MADSPVTLVMSRRHSRRHWGRSWLCKSQQCRFISTVLWLGKKAQIHRDVCTNHQGFCSQIKTKHLKPTPNDCSKLEIKNNNNKKKTSMNNCENHLIVCLCVQPARVQCSFCVLAPSRQSLCRHLLAGYAGNHLNSPSMCSRCQRVVSDLV